MANTWIVLSFLLNFTLTEDLLLAIAILYNGRSKLDDSAIADQRICKLRLQGVHFVKDAEEMEQEALYDNPIINDGTGIEPDDKSSDGRILTPFDPTLIRIDTKPMTIHLLLERIKYNELVQPGFQRKAGIWPEGSQSRLIESILIRIPLPAFYIDATDDDKWLIVDGLQRLTTLDRFVLKKKLRLCELEFLTHLNGKIYDDLPRNLQRRIEETQVIVYLIQKGSPTEVKFNIFSRINTEGLPLSSQEIRHALYQGKATDLLDQLANSYEFKTAIDNGIRDDRMADRECILRFLAFTINSYHKYDRDLNSFLNAAMNVINQMTDQEIVNLQNQFKRAMIAAYHLFGRDAFRKRYRVTAPRSPINKALFESWSVNLNHLTGEKLRLLIERKAILRENFIRLMNDRNFDSAVSQSTGAINKVRLRFEAIEKLIEEVLQ